MFGIGLVAMGLAAALGVFGGAGAIAIGLLVGALAYLEVFVLVVGYWTARLQNLAWGHTASARLRLEAITVVSEVDPDEFAATAAQADEAAAGDAAGDLLGLDIGL